MNTEDNERLQERVEQVNRMRNIHVDSKLLLKELKARFIDGCKWAVEGYTDPDFVYHYIWDAIETLDTTLNGLASFGLISYKQAEYTMIYCEQVAKGQMESKGLL